MPIHSYSKIADLNTSVGSGGESVSIDEGMARDKVNNAIRAMAADIADWRNDLGAITTGGTSATFTINSDEASVLTYYEGLRLGIKFHADCADDAQFKIGTLPAVNIKMKTSAGPQNVTSRAIKAGDIHVLVYDGEAFQISGAANFGAIYAEHFTDVNSALQYSVTLPTHRTAGFVKTGLYNIAETSPIVIPDGAIFEGLGQVITQIENTDTVTPHFMVESEDFDTLYGTNAWLYSDGVPTFLGIQKLNLYGGKRPPTIASLDRGGARFYGKSLLLSDILINNVDGVGLWTACGQQVGQTIEWDMPEGDIQNVKIKRSGGHGWLDDGPHDCVAYNVAIAEAGFAESGAPTGNLYGHWVREQIGNYTGHGEKNTVHIYGTQGTGARIDSVIRSTQYQSESNTHQDVIFGSTSRNSDIKHLLTFGSQGGPSGDLPSVLIEAGATKISIGEWESPGGALQNGIEINGDRCSVGIKCNYPQGKTGFGLKDTGNKNITHGVISGFSGVGGVGAIFDGSTYGKHELIIDNCDTAIKIAGATSGLDLDATVQLVASSNQKVFDAATIAWLEALGPAERAKLSLKIRGTIGSNAVTSFQKLESGNIDISSTGLKTVVVPHNLCMIPKLRDIHASVSFNGANRTWRTGEPFVSAVSATDITFEIDVTTAVVSPGVFPRLSIEASIIGGV